MRWQNAIAACVVSSTLILAGCGQYVRDQGRSPVQAVIMSLEVASGAEPEEFGGSLHSDVLTEGAVFNDLAEVSMTAVLKDQGIPGLVAAPSELNRITFTRYRVEYERADGRNGYGVDVPHPFDSALTFTVGVGDDVTVSFDIVRHAAKKEAPLAALATNSVLISTIAKVTFYGRDLAGNDVMVTGKVGITFGNFADPE